jgi:hypothetical protein
MHRSHLVFILSILGVLLAAPFSAAKDKDPEPVECVRLSRTWDDAVAEAKLRNVPIVVHSHGFYCGPCWSMHKSVMCSRKYIEFAAENTVEVISLSRLEEGIEKKEDRAATYEGTRRGEKGRFMCEFPGLTSDEMLALNHSKAGTYNDTGKVPFTCLVDPYTLQEIRRWQGGTPAGEIMDAAKDARETLAEAHGEGFSGKEWVKLLGAEKEAWEKRADGEYAKALKELDKVAKKSGDWPDAAKARLEATRTEVLDGAKAAIADLESRLESEGVKVKGDVRKLISKLKGTGLEDQAEALLERS